MQTFLPYKDFDLSAKCLDNKRLGKQRVEVLQILQVLSGKTKAWEHHPAVEMWKGHTNGLIEYGLAICEEWISRGFKDTCKEKILQFVIDEESIPSVQYEHGACVTVITARLKRWVFLPWWIGNRNFHSSHRAALMAKKPEHYSQFGWEGIPKIDYYWPSRK